jgi:hypothetical protein
VTVQQLQCVFRNRSFGYSVKRIAKDMKRSEAEIRAVLENISYFRKRYASISASGRCVICNKRKQPIGYKSCARCRSKRKLKREAVKQAEHVRLMAFRRSGSIPQMRTGVSD